MTRPIPSVTAAAMQKRAGRRTTDPTVVQDGGEPSSAGTNLPIVAGPVRHHDNTPTGPLEAQIIGQDGIKRGLRGGKPVLDQARSAYLETEYSGRADRRPRRGLITKTEL